MRRCCVEIRINCKAEHLIAQHGETRIYILEVELKMDASQTERIKMLGLNLTSCQLRGLKMPLKSELELSNKN